MHTYINRMKQDMVELTILTLKTIPFDAKSEGKTIPFDVKSKVKTFSFDAKSKGKIIPCDAKSKGILIVYPRSA